MTGILKAATMAQEANGQAQGTDQRVNATPNSSNVNTNAQVLCMYHLSRRFCKQNASSSLGGECGTFALVEWLLFQCA